MNMGDGRQPCIELKIDHVGGSASTLYLVLSSAKFSLLTLRQGKARPRCMLLSSMGHPWPLSPVFFSRMLFKRRRSSCERSLMVLGGRRIRSDAARWNCQAVCPGALPQSALLYPWRSLRQQPFNARASLVPSPVASYNYNLAPYTLSLSINNKYPILRQALFYF